MGTKDIQIYHEANRHISSTDYFFTKGRRRQNVPVSFYRHNTRKLLFTVFK
jgi:hypothetical protein